MAGNTQPWSISWVLTTKSKIQAENENGVKRSSLSSNVQTGTNNPNPCPGQGCNNLITAFHFRREVNYLTPDGTEWSFRKTVKTLMGELWHDVEESQPNCFHWLALQCAISHVVEASRCQCWLCLQVSLHLDEIVLWKSWTENNKDMSTGELYKYLLYSPEWFEKG